MYNAPPLPLAELPLKVLLLILRVVAKFSIAPPCTALLLLNVLLLIVAVPSSLMTPPQPARAELLLKLLLFIVRVPSLVIAPPQRAELLLKVLLLMLRVVLFSALIAAPCPMFPMEEIYPCVNVRFLTVRLPPRATSKNAIAVVAANRIATAFNNDCRGDLWQGCAQRNISIQADRIRTTACGTVSRDRIGVGGCDLICQGATRRSCGWSCDWSSCCCRRGVQ